MDTLAQLQRKLGDLDAAIQTMQLAVEKEESEPERWAAKLERLEAEKTSLKIGPRSTNPEGM